MTDRDHRVRRVLGVEGTANLCVLLAKLAVGLATGSVAVLGDAVHSLADLANNGLALVATHLASAPPDREHPYGHRKFETLAVFVLAVLLAVLGLELVLGALRRSDRVVVGHGWSLAVMLGVLCVNGLLSIWQSRWAEALDSDLLRADARHTVSDVLTTIAVIVGWQFAARGHAWLDTVTTLGVAALVWFLAYDLLRRVTPLLVDRAAADPEQLAAVVRSVPGVREARRVRSKGVGRQVSMDVVVTVDAELTTAASHEIADAVESALRRSFSTEDVTVHVEPDRRGKRGER